MDKSRIIKMCRAEGFAELFDEEKQETRTDVDAYEKLEGEFREVMGETRYASYDSFRNSRRVRETKVCCIQSDKAEC